MARVDLFRDGLLRAPAAETVAAPVPVRPSGAPCDFCDELSAGRCVQCARETCRSHRWVMFGLCRECLTSEELRHARAAEPAAPRDLGIKWVED